MASQSPGPDGSRQLVVGVDGGQTSTRCVIATADGRIIGRGEGGPLIHLAAAGGPERFAASLEAAVAGAWETADRAPSEVEAVGLGITGVEADGDEAAIVARILPTVLAARVAAIQSDAVTALIGAHAGEPGIMAISGTGSVVFGRDRHDHSWRVGGWGWLLGDEGSALAIGRDGLIVALQAFDHAVEPTTLSAAFVEYFQVSRPRDIKNLVYAPDFGARGFGQLARVVSAEAEHGDRTAQAIVERHAQALARDVLAVTRELDFADGPIAVAAIGGAFEHVFGLRSNFELILGEASPRVNVGDAALPPVLGAVLLAAQAAGIATPAMVSRLREDEERNQ